MSAEHEMAPPAPPFRLQTFGTLALRGPEGNAPTADQAQQKRLGLLAVLAASGGRGCSRDRLLLLFWPDSSQQRARHSLEQLLYLIRRSVDASAFVGVNPIRLNPAVMTADVVEFEKALADGDLASAVGLYSGPFLEGFYLGDAPEFEQWKDGERARLEGEYTKALERLAQNAEGIKDYDAAAGWWRKLADADPVSSRHAVGLMRALAKTGDHAAALRHAERYERLVEQELGTGAGPEIASLAAEIRASAEAARASPPRPAHRPVAPTAPPASHERAPETPTVAPRGRRRADRAALYGIGAFLLAVIIFAAIQLRDPLVDAPAAEDVEPSIAVLPLSNLSADPDDAVFADGMTEELIAMLAKTGELRVIASTSAFAFRDRQTDVRSIADSLRVSNILEGGVQKVGSRLRVQVRLVDARDGSTRWSETYDREIEDLFAVQAEIAQAVARELGARLGRRVAPPRSRHTQNVAAYELYLRGNDTVHLRSDSGPHKALEYFRQAVALDSTYAAAYAGLSRMYGRVTSTPDPGRPIPELRALQLQAALKAVALDDSVAEGHGALGLVRVRLGDYRSAEMELKRAIELDPTQGRTREWLAGLYLRTGRPAEALAETRRSLEIDPLSPTAHAELARALIANGRYDEALTHLEHIRNVQPPLLRTGGLFVRAYAMKGMWEEAIAANIEDGRPLGVHGYLLARSGKREEAQRILQTLLARIQQSDADPFEVVQVYAGLGDYDRAFAWLDRTIDDRAALGGYFDIMEDPFLEELRRDPRFKRVKERLGIQNR